MELRLSRYVRVAVVTAAMLVVCASSHSWAQAGGADRLNGTWVMNKLKSTQPGSVQSQDAANDTMSDAQLAQLKEVKRALSQAFVQLSIVTTGTDMTVTGGGTTQKFTTDGKKQDVQMGAAKVGLKTKWDKNQMKQEVAIGPATMTRTWLVSDDGKQLTLSSTLTSGQVGDGAAAAIKFVYDKQ